MFVYVQCTSSRATPEREPHRPLDALEDRGRELVAEPQKDVRQAFERELDRIEVDDSRIFGEPAEVAVVRVFVAQFLRSEDGIDDALGQEGIALHEKAQRVPEAFARRMPVGLGAQMHQSGCFVETGAQFAPRIGEEICASTVLEQAASFGQETIVRQTNRRGATAIGHKGKSSREDSLRVAGRRITPVQPACSCGSTLVTIGRPLPDRPGADGAFSGRPARGDRSVTPKWRNGRRATFRA